MRISHYKELHMSWYKKSPVKHPKTTHTPPHRTSPLSEKAIREAKRTSPGAERTEREHKEQLKEQYRIDFYT